MAGCNQGSYSPAPLLFLPHLEVADSTTRGNTGKPGLLYSPQTQNAGEESHQLNRPSGTQKLKVILQPALRALSYHRKFSAYTVERERIEMNGFSVSHVPLLSHPFVRHQILR